MAAMVEHEGDAEMLRERMAELQASQIAHNRRAIILIEGLAGSGKKAALRAITGALDPCHFAVQCTTFDRRESADGHWLARYWRALPAAGSTAIFFRGWYHRVLDERVAGRIDDKAATRAFDEINEFEAQQRDYGTLIVKIFFHVTAATQERRIAERQADEWRRHLIGPAELRAAPGRASYRTALEQMLAQTDTRWAPWSMIDANDDGAAQVAALTAIADGLEKALPKAPPEAAATIIPFIAAERKAQPAG